MKFKKGGNEMRRGLRLIIASSYRGVRAVGVWIAEAVVITLCAALVTSWFLAVIWAALLLTFPGYTVAFTAAWMVACFIIGRLLLGRFWLEKGALAS
jgi:hypothetical protein